MSFICLKLNMNQYKTCHENKYDYFVRKIVESKMKISFRCTSSIIDVYIRMNGKQFLLYTG